MEPINWHYPRVALATAYLAQFEQGLSHSITLFAPRRKGKTEFLLKDLAPAAEARGYKVCYVSMWTLKTNPAAALLAGLAEANRDDGLFGRIGRALTSPLNTVEAEAAFAGFGLKLGADLNPGGEPAGDALLQIPALLDTLAARARNHTLLLLLDEVQFLAKPAHETLVAALRTALDVRKDTVHTVFTGSSRVRLQQMFDTLKAPLFQFSQRTHFPDLGEDFTRFMAHNFRLATQRELDPAHAWRGFETLGFSPGLYREAINLLALEGGLDFLGLCARVREEAESRAGMHSVWQDLKPFEQLVVKSVLRGESLYADETRQRYAQALGVDAVSPSQVQAALTRLVNEQILFGKARGEYEIEDTGFQAWLARHLQEQPLLDPPG